MSPLHYQAPRGTTDILPDEQAYWRLFRSKVEEAAALFGYDRIDTPIIEDARLFVRGIGEVTDIIERETYTFQDRGGDLITLRPEGTAGVCRAYLQHGMHNLPQPVRLYYLGPLFRYERPQAGRFRQHHQFGIEALGDGDPAIDAEIIELAWTFLGSLGLRELAILINSTGDPDCRPAYIRELQGYYRPHVQRLCHNCRRRLEENPLRLLDCKENTCQPVIAGAPGGVDHLCAQCAGHWRVLLDHLGNMGLPYRVDKRLVRGFDYYTRTVFEIVPPVEGRQSTIVGGGRYDGLIQDLGGKPTPGIGFGMGIERVLSDLQRQEAGRPELATTKVLVAHTDSGARLPAMALGSELRGGGVAAVLAPSERSLKGQLRYASSINATHAVIIGQQELERGTVIVRDLGKREQTEVASGDALDRLKEASSPSRP